MNLHYRSSENASAALIVIVLLAVIVSLAIGNNIALANLKRELVLVEHRQAQRYGDAVITNQPAINHPHE